MPVQSFSFIQLLDKTLTWGGGNFTSPSETNVHKKAREE